MRNILIVLFAMVMVCSFANAQGGAVAVSDAQFQVTVIGAAIDLSTQDGVIENLAPGYTYTADPLAAFYAGTGIVTGVTPLVKGDETYSTPMQFQVTAGIDGNYQVSFVLPTELVETGTAGGTGLGLAPMKCSFGAKSGFLENNSTYINPNVANVLYFQAGVTGIIDLGITVTTNPVTDMTGSDATYVGSVVCTVAMTGL